MKLEKKQILQKILEAIVPYWKLAEWFLLILNEEWNDELIEQLHNIIKEEIKNINNEKDRNNIKQALQKIQKKECQEKQRDDEYLEDLINNI